MCIRASQKIQIGDLDISWVLMCSHMGMELFSAIADMLFFMLFLPHHLIVITFQNLYTFYKIKCIQIYRSSKHSISGHNKQQTKTNKNVFLLSKQNRMQKNKIE